MDCQLASGEPSVAFCCVCSYAARPENTGVGSQLSGGGGFIGWPDVYRLLRGEEAWCGCGREGICVGHVGTVACIKHDSVI